MKRFKYECNNCRTEQIIQLEYFNIKKVIEHGDTIEFYCPNCGQKSKLSFAVYPID